MLRALWPDIGGHGGLHRCSQMGPHEIGIVRADLGRPSEFIVLLCLFALWLLPGLKVRPAVTTIPRDSSSQTMRLSRLARTVAGI